MSTWAQEELHLLMAALYSYLTRQEKNRDQAVRKFGPDAQVGGVNRRIAILNRMIDQVEAEHDQRFGARSGVSRV